jgi:hypothetical protein
LGTASPPVVVIGSEEFPAVELFARSVRIIRGRYGAAKRKIGSSAM